MMPTEIGPSGVGIVLPPMTSPRRRHETNTAPRQTNSLCVAVIVANGVRSSVAACLTLERLLRLLARLASLLERRLWHLFSRLTMAVDSRSRPRGLPREARAG